jgi:hypothetical protein
LSLKLAQAAVSASAKSILKATIGVPVREEANAAVMQGAFLVDEIDGILGGAASSGEESILKT